MKFDLYDEAIGFLWFPGDKFLNLILFFFQKLDLSVFVDLEKFQPWFIGSELWSTKTSLFMHGLSWNLLYMMKQ